MKLLGDTICVNNFEHIEKKSNLLIDANDITNVVGPVKGKVIHIGTEASKKATEIKVGDEVVVMNHHGTRLGDGSRIYNREDILAIIEQ